jgi:NDP-sugar pyrophosphorylase family protein
MHAVILAGGSGTRLRPLTYARRKELMPVLGRPLLEYRIENLRDNGIDQIVLACSSAVRELEAHFGDGSRFGVRIQYAYEERPLGSGRAVKEAARMAEAEGLLVVCNGDILTNVDLTAMMQAHWKARATLSMSLARVDDPWNYGVVEVDDSLRIHGFVEKPPQGQAPSDLINAGTWLWEPEILEMIPDDQSAAVDQFSERVLFPGIIADGLAVQGFEEDLWVDVGAPDRYLRANTLMLERASVARGSHLLIEEDVSIAPDATITGMLYVSSGASIKPGARIAGPVVIGERSEVGAAASVESSVLWEDVTIGAGARVAGSIIGGRVTIGAGTDVRNAVIADGARVAGGARLQVGARVEPDEAVR